MPLPRFVDISGKRYRWRYLVDLHRVAAAASLAQSTLFELREDYRPVGERGSAEHRQAPDFLWIERTT
jgi:hypothetical protein